MGSRIDALETGAPDVVGAWRGIDEGTFVSIRREVRRQAGPGSAVVIVPQLAAVAAAISAIVTELPDEALRLPGGEADWNVAQAVGHAAEARAGLALAASMAAAGRWPHQARPVVPGIPGVADADRDALLRRIATSQRIVERAARSVAGHELDPCPLEHPLVGRLRCGEWLLFAGVHDLMHLDQLERIEQRLVPA
jgi:DinB superfamily